VAHRRSAPVLRQLRADERRTQDRLSQIVKAALNDEITKRTVREVISSQRNNVMDAIQARVANEAKQIGVEVIDVRLRAWTTWTRSTTRCSSA
jgi:regulator of protease activity HflC (stomatin/prohibitin superfamily)